MDSTVTALLKRVSIFSELEDSALLELARQCQRRHYKKNEAIFHQGDLGHAMYIVCAGRVNVQNDTETGTVHIARRGPGEYFGEMALIDGKPRMADVMTAEPTELLTLHQDAFIRCIEERPRIALKVMAILADRLREAAEFTQELQGMDVLGRVAGVLYDRISAGSAPEPGGGRRLTPNVTQKQLAAEVGATRESVNRALANLKKTRIICMDGRALIILNEKKLRELGGR